jgi:hypothetical protein
MPLNPRPREPEVDPTSARPGNISSRDEEREERYDLGLDASSVHGRVAIGNEIGDRGAKISYMLDSKRFHRT